MSDWLDDIVATLRTEAKPDAELRALRDQARDVELPQVEGRYALRLTPVSFGPKFWSYLVVEILDTASRARLGHYVRTYSAFYRTFLPFARGGRHYALYSRDYTATRVMSLPDCRDLGGEEKNSWGFCPTDFHVPDQLGGDEGFVAGCVWGDDSSWKIQYLDLRRIDDGVLVREARFGYLVLPDGVGLADAIDLRYHDADSPMVTIRTEIEFDLRRAVDLDFARLPTEEYERQLDREDPTRGKKCRACGHAGRDHEAHDEGRVCVIYEKGKSTACRCDAFAATDEDAD